MNKPEYVWLVVAGAMAVLLVWRYDTFNLNQKLVMGLGVAVAAFMYSLRSTQRKRAQQAADAPSQEEATQVQDDPQDQDPPAA